jgi:hypothetical protein
MTDQPTEATVTVASQSVELLLTGKPDVKYKWDSGSIRPGLVIFTYRQDGIHAHLYGSWVCEDGELTDAPVDQEYRIGDTDEWPDWMGKLAIEHHPRSVRAVLLREAADECDEAGAAYTARALNDHAGGAFALMETFLRKADEAEYVATPCSAGGCEPGGEPCDTHERLMAHAEGDHELCERDCGTSPSRMAGEAQQPETQGGCSQCGHRACMGRGRRCGVVMTSEAGIVRPPCQCLGAAVSQPGKEA